jgi:thioredoxin-dependent peroxiredoxin
MVRSVRCLAILLLLVSTTGARAGDIVLHEADGDAVFKLSEAQGKYVALHFLLKTACPHCIRHTHEVWQRQGEMPDVMQIFVKPDTEEEIRKWSVRLGKKVDEGEEDALPVIYRDPEAGLAKRLDIPFGYKFHGQIVHYPALVLLGPDGEEVFRYVGKNNGDRYSFDQLNAKVAEVKAGTGDR